MFCKDYKSKVSKSQATDWSQPTEEFGLAHATVLKIGDFPLKKKKKQKRISIFCKSEVLASVLLANWQASARAELS